MVGQGGRFGDYELLDLLGRGGMGEVWRAEDTRRGRTVALKLLAGELTARPDFQERFRREAQLTAVLSSPHVVPIHDWGEIDGRLFLDMRLVDGGSLADALADRPTGLPPARALRVLEQVAAALDAAHERSMVHRDVKSANVLVTGRPDTPFSYLTDFGIARIVDETSSARLTESGQVLGTLGYMAPELFTEGTATPAADVYALGCLAFEMLTGRPAVDAPSVPTAMHEHVFGPVPRLAAHRPALSRLDTVLATALAKRPGDRPSSAGEFARAIAAAWDREGEPEDRPGASASGRTVRLGGPLDRTDAVTRSGGPAPGRPIRRWPVVVALATVLALGIGGSAAVVALPENALGAAGVAEAAVRRLPVTLQNGSSALVTPDGEAAFVTDANVASLQRVDLDSGAVTDRIPVSGRGPGSMRLTPDGRTLAVQLNGLTNGTRFGLSFVDLVQRRDEFVALPSKPYDIALSPDGARLFVSVDTPEGTAQNLVLEFDVASRRFLRSIPVAAEPRGLALSADGGTLAVATATVNRSGSIVLVPTGGGPITAIPVTFSPRYLAPLPDGRFVVSGAGGTYVVEPQARLVRLRLDPLVPGPQRLFAMDDGKRLVVTQPAVGSVATQVAVLDAETGRGVARAAVPGLNVAVPSPDGSRLVAMTDNGVSVIDLPS